MLNMHPTFIQNVLRTKIFRIVCLRHLFLDDLENDVKPKKRHQERRHRRRNLRKRKPSTDPEMESELERDQVTPRRIIPPPHEMLLWEPSLALKTNKKQAGKKRKNENQIVDEFQSEDDMLQPELTSTLSLKSKMRRLVKLST